VILAAGVCVSGCSAIASRLKISYFDLCALIQSEVELLRR
jgi:hypothetical protein